MKKARLPRWLIVSVCVLLALCAALLFEYQRHLVKPFYNVFPLSRDDIKSVLVDIEGEGPRRMLDEARAEELLEVFEDCRLKLKSSDGCFTNSYGSVFLTTTRNPFPREIMLSEECVGFANGNGGIAVYYVVDGAEELRQCLENIGK